MPKPSSLYNLRTIPGGYRITKFDADLNVETSYDMPLVDGVQHCSCPQMAKPTCRHRKMVPVFVRAGQVDQGSFYNFDTETWLGVDPWTLMAKLPEPNVLQDIDFETVSKSFLPADVPEPTPPTTIRRRI